VVSIWPLPSTVVRSPALPGCAGRGCAAASGACWKPRTARPRWPIEAGLVFRGPVIVEPPAALQERPGRLAEAVYCGVATPGGGGRRGANRRPPAAGRPAGSVQSCAASRAGASACASAGEGGRVRSGPALRSRFAQQLAPAPANGASGWQELLRRLAPLCKTQSSPAQRPAVLGA